MSHNKIVYDIWFRCFLTGPIIVGGGILAKDMVGSICMHTLCAPATTCST